MGGGDRLDRLAVAAALREIALRLEFRGDAPFRANAYRRGADALEAMSGDLGDAIDTGRLTHVPGIGKGLAAVIVDLHRSGRSELLDRLRAEVPSGLLELHGLPGLTPPRIRLVAESLGVRNLEDLRAAIEAGRLTGVKGFGPATVKKLSDAIARRATAPAALLLAEAARIADEIVAGLAAAGFAAQPVGELRRGLEEVGAIELLAAADGDSEALLDAMAALPRVASVEDRSGGHVRVRLAGGVPAELFVTGPDRKAAALAVLTGPSDHLARLGERAAALGLRLDAEGVKDGDGRPLDVSDEPALYARLGLPWIPPELRDGPDEVARALAGERFSDLVQVSDLQGLVHCHTVYSDGRHTVEEMARAAEAMGMRYITITDHSPTAHYARGVEIDRLRRQWDEIAAVQAKVSVRLLRGTESDILQDGSLDYPDAILEQMDVVIASVHERHRMDEREMTERVVRAMRQPVFKIWGHALGRLLQRRPSFACRMEAVLDAIASSPAAIEVNGDPRRLEMEPRFIRRARERGIPFVVSTDAHSTRELGNVRWGTIIARRGGLRRHEVLNTRDAEGFRAAVRPAGSAA